MPIEWEWRNIKTIFFREFSSFFNSALAYVFLTLFLVAAGWLFYYFPRPFFLIEQADLTGLFIVILTLYIFFIPALTMKVWSEEKRMGTIEILLTLPIRESEAVIGKFIAVMSFVGISLVFTFVIPLMVGLIGDQDLGMTVSGYLACFLAAGAIVSIGMFISYLTKHQIISFIFTTMVVAFFILPGLDWILMQFGAFARLIEPVTITYHFNSIARGVVDSRDLVYFFSVIGFFLYLNVKTIESRKLIQ
jgi:ABC-2 type transport system permease protein